MERLEEEVQDSKEHGGPSWKQTTYWGIGDSIKIFVIGGALLGGLYLASHPEHIETIKDYIFRFWH